MGHSLHFITQEKTVTKTVFKSVTAYKMVILGRFPVPFVISKALHFVISVLFNLFQVVLGSNFSLPQLSIISSKGCTVTMKDAAALNKTL